MTAPDVPRAVHRKGSWPGWIWSVPLAAVGIAIWLGVQSLANTGLRVTVIFPVVTNLKPGDTKVTFQDLEVGEVETVSLEKDLRHLRVTLSLQGDMAGQLGPGTRFWLSGDRPSLSSISSIRSIISGPSIGVEPAPGKNQSVYVGLPNKPPITFGTEGTSFVLHARTLGSIQRGTPIYYLDQEVGLVRDIRMTGDQGFDISAFIDKPYDRFVHAGSRFWSAGAVALNQGASGPSLQLQSVPALVEGAVSFETPGGRDQGAQSHAGDHFALFDDKEAAQYAPASSSITYRLRFRDVPDPLAANAAVMLEGIRIGSVISSTLVYDANHGHIGVEAVIGLDPSRITLADGSAWTAPRAQMNAMLQHLLAQGFEAMLLKKPPIIGGQIVELRPKPGEHAALIPGPSPEDMPEIPTASGSDLSGIMATACDVMSKVDKMPLPEIASDVHVTTHQVAALATSPALHGTLRHLDHVSANTDAITRDARDAIPPTLAKLRQTIDEAQRTLASTQNLLSADGGSIGQPQSDALPHTLYEITRAARSLRELSDYLERHPESLVTGRGRGG